MSFTVILGFRERRIWTNFDISKQKRSISVEANAPWPSLRGPILFSLTPTRLSRHEKKMTHPSVHCELRENTHAWIWFIVNDTLQWRVLTMQNTVRSNQKWERQKFHHERDYFPSVRGGQRTQKNKVWVKSMGGLQSYTME